MANHLTPEELSKELGIDRQEVIRVCVEEGVPIYQGKIDKTLFQAQLEALGRAAGTALRRGGRLRPLTPARPSGRLTRGCALRRPLFAAAFFFGAAAVLRPCASATLRLSASIRSTTGASRARAPASRSPGRRAWPRAPGADRCGTGSRARTGRTRRRGSASPAGRGRARPSSPRCPATASSISACERTSSARKSVSSTSASPFGRMSAKYSAPRRTKRPIAPISGLLHRLEQQHVRPPLRGRLGRARGSRCGRGRRGRRRRAERSA